MFLTVPLAGDSITTKDGVEYKVISYTNYRSLGPAVHVEHTEDVPSEPAYFNDIAKINSVHVDFVPGQKVFKSAVALKRKYQLPQIGDKITFKKDGKVVTAEVKSLKLHKKSDLSKDLAKGLMVKCTGDNDTEYLVRLDDMIDIDRQIGNDIFSKDAFLRLYDDYRGHRIKVKQKKDEQ